MRNTSSIPPHALSLTRTLKAPPLSFPVLFHLGFLAYFATHSSSGVNLCACTSRGLLRSPDGLIAALTCSGFASGYGEVKGRCIKGQAVISSVSPNLLILSFAWTIRWLGIHLSWTADGLHRAGRTPTHERTHTLLYGGD